MIKYALKQIWNQFRHNSWLLIELTIVFVIVWLVVAPLYTIQYQKAIPNGFDPENLYIIDIKPLSKTSTEYSSKDDSDQKLIDDISRLGNIVKADPNIEAVAIQSSDIPWGGSYSGYTFNAEGDSTMHNAQYIAYLKGWDLWKVFRFTSATDNSWETVANNSRLEEGVTITKDIDKVVFKDKNGSKVKRIKFKYEEKYYPVVEVVNYIKRMPAEQPGPIIFVPLNSLDPDDIRYSTLIILRVKEGVTESKFLDSFNNNIKPKLKIGNLRVVNISKYSALAEDLDKWVGTSNIIRTKTILTIFFLLITFLGVVASFWLRTESKKGEIGLNMALGADRSTIKLKFLLEGWILTSIASIVGFIIVLNIIYFKGVGNVSWHKIPEAWAVNNDYIYVAIVTAIVFLLIITTVTIATIIPASIAAKTNPVNALRDE